MIAWITIRSVNLHIFRWFRERERGEVYCWALPHTEGTDFTWSTRIPEMEPSCSAYNSDSPSPAVATDEEAMKRVAPVRRRRGSRQTPDGRPSIMRGKFALFIIALSVISALPSILSQSTRKNLYFTYSPTYWQLFIFDIFVNFVGH